MCDILIYQPTLVGPAKVNVNCLLTCFLLLVNELDLLNLLKGSSAVKCYTLPSRSNLHFYFVTFGHSGA